MTTKPLSLVIVVPAFNEEGNIVPLRDRVAATLDSMPRYSWRILFVDDGSSDGTREHLRQLAASDSRVSFLGFSRNFGHQAALKAGIDHADGDAMISMDADLQHPPELLPRILALWEQGFDVVYTERRDTAEVSLFKRTTSNWFYLIFNAVSGLNLSPGAADYRLLDRKVVDALRSLPESGLFLRGIIHWIGFRQVGLPYEVAVRHSGVSKYSLGKMFKLAGDGLLAFSIKPLRIASLLGCLVSAAAAIYAIYALSIHFFGKTTISGWTSLLISVLFLGGIQLLTIGLLGEYIGRILTETKRRPSYIVAEKT